MSTFDVTKITGVVKRYTSPHAIKDLDRFLDALPTNVGYNALIAVGIVWVFAAAGVLFAATELRSLNEIRAELSAVESQKPPVPKIEHIPVADDTLKRIVEEAKKHFTGLTITVSGAGQLSVSGNAEKDYYAFREFLNYLQNAGSTWRVETKTLCIGKECEKSSINADITVDSITVREGTVEKASEMK